MFLEITFTEPHNDESLGLSNVRVGRAVVTHDMIDCPTLINQVSLGLVVYTIGEKCFERLVVHVYVMHLVDQSISSLRSPQIACP